MGNTKDFILKNAIEVGADTKVTLGTITSGTVDLSTGNYFAETLAADTTYVFSNPGDVQSFQLEVTGGAVVNINNISDATYDSKSFNVAGQETFPVGIAFKADGTKMYIVGFQVDEVNQYSLSTAWDVSTATFDNLKSVSTQENNPYDIAFSADGTSMYIVGSTNDTVFQYDLSTAWETSTASYNSKSYSVQTQDGSSYGLYFKPDGTKFYIAGDQNNKVYQYSLSTAWDITTASYDSVEFSVVSQSGSVRKVWLSPQGTKMYILDLTTTTVYQYTLSTAWDISTASYDSNSFSVSGQLPAPNGMVFKPDGTKLYVCGTTTDTVYQYSTGTNNPATLTWPASVEWPAGAAPIAPAAGETDVYTFVTDDNGTTYIGLQTADNLS